MSAGREASGGADTAPLAPPAAGGEAAPVIVRLAEVPSTQAVAFDLAEQGAPDGAAVVADHQTAGRGRRGRSWHDVPGASLLVSILVRPRLEAARLPLLSYAAGLAVADALAAVAGLPTRLKWPNDVLVGGRKIAGVLLESRVPAGVRAAAAGDAGALTVTVVGIGVNVAQRAFPPPLAGRATSVALETGRPVDREALLVALLAAFGAWRARLESEGFEPIRRRWLALADTIGRPVRGDGAAGVAVGLDGDGALLVRAGAAVRRLVAGDVEA